MEKAVIFIFGALCYSSIEIMWRGYTHWTMYVVGGMCTLLIFCTCQYFIDYSLLFKTIFCGLSITIIEFLSGIIINLYLNWNVWNYSKQPFNLLGQICLGYSLIWFAISIPIILFFDYLQAKMY